MAPEKVVCWNVFAKLPILPLRSKTPSFHAWEKGTQVKGCIPARRSENYEARLQTFLIIYFMVPNISQRLLCYTKKKAKITTFPFMSSKKIHLSDESRKCFSCADAFNTRAKSINNPI